MDFRPALHDAISRLSSTWAWPTARPVANSNAGLKSSTTCCRSPGLDCSVALKGLINNEASAPAAICSRGPTAKSSTTAVIDHALFGFPGGYVISTQQE